MGTDMIQEKRILVYRRKKIQPDSLCCRGLAFRSSSPGLGFMDGRSGY